MAREGRLYSWIRRRPLLWEVVTLLVLIVVVFPLYLANLREHPFHGDENGWMVDSKYFTLFFLDRDFRDPLWDDYLAYNQPPVAKYVVGAALYFSGFEEELRSIGEMPLWDFFRSEEWNEMRGAMPPAEMLVAARTAMALMGAATCLLLYGAGRLVFGRLTGILSCLLLAVNPLMRLCCRRAMSDAPYLFFLTGCLLALICHRRALERARSLQAVWWSAMAGIGAGLAFGTKLTGAVMLGVLGLDTCTVLIKRGSLLWRGGHRGKSFGRHLVRDKTIRIAVLGCFLAVFVSLTVFVALNPFLYKSPFKRMPWMFAHRLRASQLQQEHFGVGLTSPVERVVHIWRRVFMPGEWVVLGNWFRLPVEPFLFAGGIGLALRNVARSVKRRETPSPETTVLIWTAASFGASCMTLPLDWERYYLPLVLPVVLFVSCALSRFPLWIGRLVKKRYAHRVSDIARTHSAN